MGSLKKMILLAPILLLVSCSNTSEGSTIEVNDNISQINLDISTSKLNIVKSTSNLIISSTYSIDTSMDNDIYTISSTAKGEDITLEIPDYVTVININATLLTYLNVDSITIDTLSIEASSASLEISKTSINNFIFNSTFSNEFYINYSTIFNSDIYAKHAEVFNISNSYLADFNSTILYAKSNLSRVSFDTCQIEYYRGTYNIVLDSSRSYNISTNCYQTNNIVTSDESSSYTIDITSTYGSLTIAQ